MNKSKLPLPPPPPMRRMSPAGSDVFTSPVFAVFFGVVFMGLFTIPLWSKWL